jgi:hypothetical protein
VTQISCLPRATRHQTKIHYSPTKERKRTCKHFNWLSITFIIWPISRSPIFTPTAAFLPYLYQNDSRVIDCEGHCNFLFTMGHATPFVGRRILGQKSLVVLGIRFVSSRWQSGCANINVVLSDIDFRDGRVALCHRHLYNILDTNDEVQF